mmetsp:Transcript_7232/g.8165  ORF Transcript_7232/g.8165 Transcript_7232/m.8165 type:complete len:118 (+) Transcript_7232:29-382(+)
MRIGLPIRAWDKACLRQPRLPNPEGFPLRGAVIPAGELARDVGTDEVTSLKELMDLKLDSALFRTDGRDAASSMFIMWRSNNLQNSKKKLGMTSAPDPWGSSRHRYPYRKTKAVNAF